MSTQRIIRTAAILLVALSAGACSSMSQKSFFGPNSAFPAAADMQADTALSKAKVHFHNGNYGLAERHYRTAVEQAPEDLEAWIGLAASYDQLKRFDLADRAYDRALDLSGGSAAVLNNLGYSHLLRGDGDKAADYFAQALAKDPSNERIKGNAVLARELVQQGSAGRGSAATL